MGLTHTWRILVGLVALGFIVVAIIWVFGRAHPEIRFLTGTPFKAAYLVFDPDASNVSVHITIQSGEAQNQGVEGLAHFLEHLTWLNSIPRLASDTPRDTNASTTHFATDYWLSGPTEKLPDFVKSLMNIFNPIVLDAKFANEERDVILREYASGFGDNIVARAYREVNRELYAGTGLARSVIGTPDEISRFSFEDAKRLHANTHVIKNAVLIVSGNISLKELGNALSAALPSDLEKPAPASASLQMKVTGQSLQTFADEDQQNVLLWKKLVKLESPIEFERLQSNLDVLADILDTDLPGGLAGPLRFDAFIASSFSIGLKAIDEQFVEIQFVANPDKNTSLPELQAAFEKALVNVASTGIIRSTYDRVKARSDENLKRPDIQEQEANQLLEHVVNRALAGRVPQSTDAFWSRTNLPDPALMSWILKKSVGPGRTSIAYIGKEASFK